MKAYIKKAINTLRNYCVSESINCNECPLDKHCTKNPTILSSISDEEVYKILLPIDIARQYIIFNIMPLFKDGTFEEYITKRLAGDFACELADLWESGCSESVTYEELSKLDKTALMRSCMLMHSVAEDLKKDVEKLEEQNKELLEALKEFLAYYEADENISWGSLSWGSLSQDARAIIKKAEGVEDE